MPVMKPPTTLGVDKNRHRQLPTSCAIKPSLSMTSLPPNGLHDNNELAQAKLRIDRPYHSLKKKRDSERELWRRSWESAHSHSSCSLHSNATGTGKDDFWAALQTNYNYIMDTNLLDSCREARGEIEGAVEPDLQVSDCCEKSIFQSSKSQGSVLDPRRLRRWLREMETCMAKSPTLSEAMKMKSGELQKRLTEHSDLYREIVSQARVVGACIRAAEKETATPEVSTSSSNKASNEKSPPTPTAGRKSEANLKGLEKRYHLLYLKAFEVQCMLESLLGRKSSPSPVSSRTPSDTDEEPVAKQARLCSLSSLGFDGKSGPDVFQFKAGQQQEKYDENRSDDEWGNGYFHSNSLEQAAGFEADSEGSDCEIPSNTKPSLSSLGSNGTSSGTPLSSLSIPTCGDQQNMETENHHELNDDEQMMQEIPILPLTANAVISSSIKNNLTSPQKRPRKIDISKFNRSNRKSKNCAIFYFKHLDTDSEHKGLSSQGSEAFKSGEPSSDEEWYFTNANKSDDNKNSSDEIINGNTDSNLMDLTSKNNNPNHVNGNMTVDVVDYYNGNDTTITMVNSFSENATIILNNNEENDSNAVSDESQLKPQQQIQQEEPRLHTAIMQTNYETSKRVIKCSKESIHQLVLGAETLVREEVLLKSPKITTCNSLAEVIMMSSSRKCDKIMQNPKIKLVQEWLEHQPIEAVSNRPSSVPTTDCEASGEYTESDCATRDSDTSEGLADSVATCLQGGSNSQATSTEKIGGSAEPLVNATIHLDSNLSPQQQHSTKVILRSKRRNSDRPWSVSSLSQLTKTINSGIQSDSVNNQLASFSISESALHTLSSPTVPVTQPSISIRNSDSKNSLKKRRFRMKKRSIGRKSESGSDGTGPHCDLPRFLTKNLVKSESFSGQSNIIQEQTIALSLLQISRKNRRDIKSMTSNEMESEEDGAGLMKPVFRLGSYTNVFVPGGYVTNLGSLAALANYDGDNEIEKLLNRSGIEELTSEQAAWDNYQEKYNSENYSEGLDSDAARRLLEFGDDYRNFLDSQSDCCSSSLSAANNMDSMSPPRLRKQIGSLDSKSPSDAGHDSNTLRRRRALEQAEHERRRKNSDGSRRRLSDDRRKSFGTESSNSARLSPRNGNHLNLKHSSPNSTDGTRRKQSESDNSITRRNAKFRPLSSSSSSSSSASGSESEDEIEIRNLLAQSRNRLEHTDALRIRRHLLRPEDYAEIIATCRDNVRCLEAVVRGPSVTVLSAARCQETRELLSSWESLLNWSETSAVARQLQEEMSVLKGALNRLGTQCIILDSESAIQITIEELKNEKTKLHSHRSTMLKLNASVHSWLTRQEMEMSKMLENRRGTLIVDSENCQVDLDKTISIEKLTQSDDILFYDSDLHKHLKDSVGDMYGAWDDADHRVSNHLENLTTSLMAWKQLESGLSEFQEALGKDKGALKGLKGALEKGKSTPHDLAHDVKEVAKLLSEKVESNVQNKLHQSDNIHLLHPSTAILYSVKSSSNGSLSDSGISDGGCGSDGGLSERERRLGALRRLAKQLEAALAPGSDALKSIFQRMEAAEAELRTLQNTCRELIVRTAVTQHFSKASDHGVGEHNNSDNQASSESESPGGGTKMKQKKSPQSKRKNKRRSPSSTMAATGGSSGSYKLASHGKSTSGNLYLTSITEATSDPDPDDPRGSGSGILLKPDDGNKKRNWAWRVAKIAIPVQVALISIFCVACLFEPHCCDAINNFSMSFTPQLRYIRGPPPV